MEKISVVAAVIRRDDCVLLCQRPRNKRHGGLWEFPGGKLQIGETLIDALRRELREELLVEVVSVGAPLLIAHDAGSPFEIHFIATEIAGEPVAQEHDKIEWAHMSLCDEYPLAPCDREFVQQFFQSSESQ